MNRTQRQRRLARARYHQHQAKENRLAAVRHRTAESYRSIRESHDRRYAQMPFAVQDVGTIHLVGKTVPQLREYAKGLGITGVWRMGRQTLINAIRQAEA